MGGALTASKVCQNCSHSWLLIQTVNGHYREQLLDCPHIWSRTENCTCTETRYQMLNLQPGVQRTSTVWQDWLRPHRGGMLTNAAQT